MSFQHAATQPPSKKASLYYVLMFMEEKVFLSTSFLVFQKSICQIIFFSFSLYLYYLL